MKNIFKTFLISLATVFVAVGVQAADYDWGVHVLAPAQETSFAVGGGAAAPGAFLDTYQFSLATAGSQPSIVAVAINLFAFNIASGNYSLYFIAGAGLNTSANDTLLGVGLGLLGWIKLGRKLKQAAVV